MATPTHFEYKGWFCEVAKDGLRGDYRGEAGQHGVFTKLLTAPCYGLGAKARAAEAIKQKIDERETR